MTTILFSGIKNTPTDFSSIGVSNYFVAMKSVIHAGKFFISLSDLADSFQYGRCDLNSQVDKVKFLQGCTPPFAFQVSAYLCQTVFS